MLNMAAQSDHYVFVFDRREKDVPEIKLDTSSVKSFAELKSHLQEVVRI